MDFEIADFPFLKRELYVNRFLPFLDKNIIKILTGHRRVGKSYMLFQIIEMLREKGIKPEQIIYINKELAESQRPFILHRKIKEKEETENLSFH